MRSELVMSPRGLELDINNFYGDLWEEGTLYNGIFGFWCQVGRGRVILLLYHIRYYIQPWKP